MTRNTLRKVFFEIGNVALPRTSPDGPFTEEGQALANKLTTAVRRFAVLSTFLERELRIAKASVGVPPASMVWISLEADAVPNPIRSARPAETIELSLPYDPIELLNVPTDREALALFQLEIARQAATHLCEMDGFPIKAWEQGCARFERNGFAFWMKAGERLVPGTRIKGQVAVEVAPDTTTRWLTLSHRGQTLAQIELHSRQDAPDFVTSKFFRGFELEEATLKLGADPFAVEVSGRTPVWPAEQIDLREYPDVLALAVEKEWISI